MCGNVNSITSNKLLILIWFELTSIIFAIDDWCSGNNSIKYSIDFLNSSLSYTRNCLCSKIFVICVLSNFVFLLKSFIIFNDGIISLWIVCCMCLCQSFKNVSFKISLTQIGEPINIFSIDDNNCWFANCTSTVDLSNFLKIQKKK